MDELQISSQGWTTHSGELYFLITRSSDFMRDLQFFFGTSQVSRRQSAIGAELMMEAYKEVLAAAVQKVRGEETLAPVPYNVREMSMEGLAKVRYVGAWAICKVKKKRNQVCKSHYVVHNNHHEGVCLPMPSTLHFVR